MQAALDSRTHAWAALLLACLLAGCATERPGSARAEVESEARHADGASALRDWSPRELPGKKPTRYRLASRAGQACVLAEAERSVSLWRRPLALSGGAQLGQFNEVQFDWWIGSHEGGATVAEAATDDAVARLVLGFDGDQSQLSLRNRMQFELVQTLTGEAPPFATLMYVWDAQAAPGSLIISQRSDRIRKIVVGSGAMAAGWQRLRRDVRADYQRAFGEEPGRLISMALMTDGDNTASRAEACYGSILLLDAAGQPLPGSLLL
ncbi:MAG: DUF3047 domain-containing protein [Burkholderiaceae bacterium]